jgi:hypothetical protein
MCSPSPLLCISLVVSFCSALVNCVFN